MVPFAGTTAYGRVDRVTETACTKGAHEVKGRPGLVLAAVLILAPLTACGAGRSAETLHEGSTIDGANAQTGDLRIRDVYLPYPTADRWPAGATIPVYLSVVNTSQTQPDTLTGGSSPIGTVTVSPAGGPPASPATPSPIPLSTPAVGTNTPVPLPGGQTVDFGAGSQARLVISGTTTPLRAAGFAPITLRFAEAGEVTVEAPVGSGYGPGAPPSGGNSPASGEPSPS